MQNRCCCAKGNCTKLIMLLYTVRLRALEWGTAALSRGVSAGSKTKWKCGNHRAVGSIPGSSHLYLLLQFIKGTGDT